MKPDTSVFNQTASCMGFLVAGNNVVLTGNVELMFVCSVAAVLTYDHYKLVACCIA